MPGLVPGSSRPCHLFVHARHAAVSHEVAVLIWKRSHYLPFPAQASSSRSKTPSARGSLAGILQAMQQPASSASSSAPPTFAGVMAALAAATQKNPDAWIDDDLADDVATLSYERSLDAQARYRTPEPSDRSLTGGPLTDRTLTDWPITDRTVTDRAFAKTVDAGSLRIYEALPADPDWKVRPATVPESYAVTAAAASETPPGISTAYDRNLKRASITIRLSKTECAQLRGRAAEAGLTVSAYLRSCTVEAESLRAQVMDTMAQMRAEKPKGNQGSTAKVSRRWFDWRRWFLPHSHDKDRAIRV